MRGGKDGAMKKIFVHGSGQRAAAWEKAVRLLEGQDDILCPELAEILGGRRATYGALYASFAGFCDVAAGRVHLCGLSLGGILSLHYALDRPEKVATLALIGTPHKVPKAAFAVQNLLFRCLPRSLFAGMAFDKKDTFSLGNSMKRLDFSDRVQDIGCPTLIVCGAKDRANIRSARFLAEKIRNAKLRLLEKTGHVVNEEAPEALESILKAFYGAEAERPGGCGWRGDQYGEA